MLSFSYDADRLIPCDSLDFTAVIQHHNDEFSEVTAYLDGNLFFEGIVDTHERVISDKGLLVKFNCRNKTALLIDNEVKPNIYSRLTSTQLFDQYARPFGVVGNDFPYNTTNWLLQVKKGSSNWTVIEGYCDLNFHAIPYINHKRILTLSPYNDTVHIISNNKKDALKFTSLRIINDYHKLVSRLYMKTATETYGYYYGVVVDNPNAIAKKVRRERYFHPSDVRPTVGERETRRVVDDTNRDYFKLIVVIPYLANIHVGDCVQIFDERYTNINLYVSAINLKANESQGLVTTLTLKDKKFTKGAI